MQVSASIQKAEARLKELLDTSPTIKVIDNTMLTVVNEQFNWQQMASIIAVAEEFGVAIIAAVQRKAIHDSVCISLVDNNHYSTLKTQAVRDNGIGAL